MRRVVVVALACALLAMLAPGARPDTPVFSIVRVPVESRAEAQYLFNHFDETHNHRPGWVELLLWPGDAPRLTAAGFDYRVVVKDVVARDIARLLAPQPVVSLPGPDRSDYRRLADYNEEMRGLVREHRGLVRLVRLPDPTLEGRRVLGVEIAARVRKIDGRPTFYVDGVHHAREWPAGEYPMIFAHYLVERFGKNDRVTKLLRRARVLIVPVVNADGFDYSRESVVDAQGVAGFPLAIAGAEAYWRKNRRSVTGFTLPEVQRNPDAFGVDPNRNYSFMWGDSGGGSSGTQVDQTYRGREPFSEPETQNVKNLILSRHVTGVITNHTYGRLVLRAWGHTSEDSPDEATLRPLGARMAEAMGGYQNLKGIGLYATTGTTDDWAYAATGALGYTFEHDDEFHPPYASSVGEEWRGVMRAFLIMAEAAAVPKNHAVVRGRVLDRNGRPVRATVAILKSFRTPLGRGNPTGKEGVREFLETKLKTRPDGRFTWHVNPSTRPHVRAKGRSETYTLAIVRNGFGVFREIEVDRGRRLDLGTVRLTKKLGKVQIANLPAATD